MMSGTRKVGSKMSGNSRKGAIDASEGTMGLIPGSMGDASYVVVGVMAVIALAYLEPANVAVLFELRKPQPDGEVIAKLMRRFVYTAGITGVMQVATLLIMTRLVS